MSGPLFSLDVECDIGTTGLADVVIRIALVNEQQTLVDEYIKPTTHIIDHLTHIHGITQMEIDAHGVSFETARRRVLAMLPASAILVGQEILIDIKCMHLTKGTHFQDSVDTAELYRGNAKPRARPGEFGHYKHSLKKLCQTLLGRSQPDPHQPAVDAKLSLEVYQHWLRSSDVQRTADQALLNPNRRRAEVRCYKCDGLGHIARNCHVASDGYEDHDESDVFQRINREYGDDGQAISHYYGF